MRLTIKIECENEAFAERDDEIARLLSELSDRFRHESSAFFLPTRLRDINGNSVGYAEFTDEEN